MATMNELTEKLKALQALAEEEDVDPEVLRDTLEAVEGEFEIKAEGYARVMGKLQHDIDGINEEIKRLTARKVTITNNISRMKDCLQSAMETTGKRKFSTSLYSFSIQRNPVSVSILDEDAIPDRFLKYARPTPDKAAIKAFLTGNGPQEWAMLSQSESLRIK